MLGVAFVLCGRSSAQITGTVSSAVTGMPIADALVMGEGLNWTYTDASGRYSLPPARFRGRKAPPQLPVSFRREGYQPVTRIASAEDAVLDIALEDGKSSEWTVPLCRDVWRTRKPCGEGLSARTHSAVGQEMVLTLPCDAEEPRDYGDVDYFGQIVLFKSDSKTYSLRTMWGPTCCSGHPLADACLSSRSFSERSWPIKLPERRIDGLDARGVSRDGTYWRWIGPLLGEFVEYKGADLEAAKYFDAILDSVCFQPKF
jgi:hypothetical protein